MLMTPQFISLVQMSLPELQTLTVDFLLASPLGSRTDIPNLTYPKLNSYSSPKKLLLLQYSPFRFMAAPAFHLLRLETWTLIPTTSLSATSGHFSVTTLFVYLVLLTLYILPPVLNTVARVILLT